MRGEKQIRGWAKEDRKKSESKRKSKVINDVGRARGMGREYHFWVYILGSRSRNLYVGMTNNLVRRIGEHRDGSAGTHTGHYAIHRLVYFEYFQYVRSAIRREKLLKHWPREQKIQLIEKTNATWEDLYPKLLESLGVKSEE
jgi:putative endonuclease